MAAPKFLQRLSRIPEVVNLLSAYPQGLPLRDLAAQFDTDVETLRQDINTYLGLESWGWLEDIFHRPAIEFVSPERDFQTDGSGGTLVRLVPEATAGLGAEYLSAGDLSVVYTAGAALLDVDPDDQDLSDALEVIAETMYGEPSAVPRVGDWIRKLRVLQDGQEQRRKVKIVYSRAWAHGVTERVIEPLRLVQTKRGWEVDAGPVGPEGNLRTFLLSNVRSVEPLDESFEPPAGVASLLAKQRKTTSVQMTIAQDARWAARQFAETSILVAEDEDSVTLDLELLPPIGERVALIMLASGTATKVKPGSLLPDALRFVEELLHHHEGLVAATAPVEAIEEGRADA